MKKQLVYIIILLFATRVVMAQAFSPTKVITTAVPSLRVYADARAAGMANLGLATSADANSIFINSAKTPFASSSAAIGINYTPWMRDAVPGMYLAGVSGYKKIDDEQTVLASLRYFNLGDYELHNTDGILIQTSKPNELLLDLGYARKLSEKLAVSIVLRYIRSSLFNGTVGGTTYKSANGIAGDVSVFYNGLNDEGQGFTGGFAFTNLGSKISYTNDAAAKEFIPANIGIGGAYTTVINEDHSITFGLDVNKLLVPAFPDSAKDWDAYYKMGVLESYGKSSDNGDWRLSVGIEYTYQEQFSVRAGYLAENKNMAERNGFTTGLGVKFNAWHLNVGYIAPAGTGANRNPLSNTLLFGLLLDIGKEKK